jgi:hypothetical protein
MAGLIADDIGHHVLMDASDYRMAKARSRNPPA